MLGYAGNDALQYGFPGFAAVAEDHSVSGRGQPGWVSSDQIELPAGDGVEKIAAQALDLQPVELCVEGGEVRGSGGDICRYGMHPIAAKLQRTDAAAAAEIEAVATAGWQQPQQSQGARIVGRKYHVVDRQAGIALRFRLAIRRHEKAVHRIKPDRAKYRTLLTSGVAD